MSDTICVALIGFSAYERQALASYFNVDFPNDAAGGARYRLVSDIDRARFIVADADQPGTATLLRQLERSGDTVFIGAQAPAEAAAWVMRPLSPVHLRRELDTLQAQREAARGPSTAPDVAAPPGPAPVAAAVAAAAVERPLPPIGREAAPPATAARGPASAPAVDPRALQVERRRSAPAPAAPQLSPQQRRELAEERRRQRVAALRPQIIRRALVVDDSDIARAFLRRLLEPYGLEVDEAAHSDEALERLSQRRYGVAFMDVDLGPASAADGLALCHTVRFQLPQPPLLVIVSAFHDPVDRVRGTLAGADAYLGKPLDAFELDRVLQSQGFNRNEAAQARADGAPHLSGPRTQA